MNHLQIFNFESNNVRVLEINNEPWFVATDVCKVLELSNPTMAVGRLENDERSKFNLGRQGETNIVNESGLYELIFASRKPSAKQFKRWIKQEVLPSIRKHGAYMTPDVIEKVLLNPDTIIQIATQLKEEQTKRREAEQIIEEQKPKVLFADSVSASNTSILIRELAKLISQNGVPIGEKRLFEWLRSNGYLIKKPGSDYNTPTQRSMELGLFEIKESTINRSNGIQIKKTPKVTGRGQLYFINKFLSQQKAI
ncbi:phage antirepressor KilAC domain-containing protein [Ureibacillus sp. Re31]|uniref:Phage antirepressor KilAC domain-containing protein n=1 Tax=Ureibacillus galli TaxID=2762222 RepID=A0ABR8XB41_9BACL|nr:phage antirepressor [Ureibacillus galli]MBD8026458.1 phage antirepressor KilAC domain-containing protein [Ureibacillus galli]